MIFSSPIFIFLFLPVVLTAYFLLGKARRNLLLILASFFFYAWGEKKFVFLIFLSILFNYLFAILIDAFRKSESGKSKWAGLVLAAAVVFNLGLLGFYKYAGFLADNLNALMHWLGLSYTLTITAVHQPLGISFFTFRALSYVLDVHNRKAAPARNPLDMFLFLSFFPLSLAGPIVRYGQMAAQIVKRQFQIVQFTSGLRRFVVGLGKKCLIANTLSMVADWIFRISPEKITPEVAWLGIVCYTLQIYFDFSGYSDMAIGLGRMFGFDFPENFNYPYISRSIREFWRRWHISLSTWFRDYIYIPLGGNRSRPARIYGNLIIVFFLCGLWHGAAWTFVLWGLWHGFFLILERTRFGRLVNGLWRPFRHMYVLLVVLIGWVFFRAETFSYALTYIRALFWFSGGNGLEYPLSLFLNLKVELALGAGVLFSGPVMPLLAGLREKALAGWEPKRIRTIEQGTSIGFAIILAFILLTSVMFLAAGTYYPFIYFKF